jgi:hypothetical protein
VVIEDKSLATDADYWGRPNPIAQAKDSSITNINGLEFTADFPEHRQCLEN